MPGKGLFIASSILHERLMRGNPQRWRTQIPLALARSLRYKAAMEQDWAAEHLQVIRTLMERSALYRRALAPIMTFVGLVGIAAALSAAIAERSPSKERAFVCFWAAVSAIALAGTFLLVRRQAIKDRESL